MRKIIIESDDLIDVLKQMTSLEMEQVENYLTGIEIPQRINYLTDEEYNKKMKSIMIDNIDFIKDKKKRIFVKILNTYNDFVLMKNRKEPVIKKRIEKSEAVLINTSLDTKKTVFVSLVGALLIPSIIPFIAVVCLSRIGYNKIQQRICINEILEGYDLKFLLEEKQKPFYEFTYNLRVDYHESNKELKELEERALNGENIMNELIKMVNPERVKLERVIIPEKNDNKEKILIKRV